MLARLLALAWPGHPRTWREVPRRLRPTLVSTARLTAAAVIGFLLTNNLVPGVVDLTGALTALLVVQATNYSTLRMAVLRVLAVLAGVLVAVGLTTWVGLTWWSLGLAISASLVLAKVLRLGAQALETPISAMLILAVQGQEVAVTGRVLTTLIGAGVGVAFMLLLPPPVPVRPASSAVGRVGWTTAHALEHAARSISEQPVTRATVGEWQSELEGVRTHVADAGRLVGEVKDARVMNPRALRSADLEPILRSALDTLERTTFSVRSLFVVVAREAPETSTPDDGYGQDVRQAFAVVLTTMAQALTRFGELVEAEVDGREDEAQRALAESLDALRESRAILTELMFVDARSEPSLWLLRGSVLSAVESVLQRLDVEERARVRARLRTRAPWAALPEASPLGPPPPPAPPVRAQPGATQPGADRVTVAASTS